MTTSYRPSTAKAKVAPQTLKEAEAGNVQAMYKTAYDYSNGNNNVTVDKQKAYYWYKKAAIEGYAPAYEALNSLLRFGDGIPEDQDQALYWLLIGAEKDNINCIQSLTIYYNSPAGNYNLPQALYWYKKIVDSGNKKYFGYNLAKQNIKKLQGEGVKMPSNVISSAQLDRAEYHYLDFVEGASTPKPSIAST